MRRHATKYVVRLSEGGTTRCYLLRSMLYVSRNLSTVLSRGYNGNGTISTVPATSTAFDPPMKTQRITHKHTSKSGTDTHQHTNHETHTQARTKNTHKQMTACVNLPWASFDKLVEKYTLDFKSNVYAELQPRPPEKFLGKIPVSYTHLTLPTICSV